MQTNHAAGTHCAIGVEPVPAPPAVPGTEPVAVDFDCRVRGADGEVVLTVLGEIDMATSPVLWAYVEEAVSEVPIRLVLDLSATTFVDSSGLALFVRAHKRLSGQRAELVLRRPKPSTIKILEITGLDRVLHIDNGSEPLAGDRTELALG